MLPPEPIQEELWRAAFYHGVDKAPLRWLVDQAKMPIYETLRKNENDVKVLATSRKVGKSYLLTVVMTELALRYPGERINLAMPTGDMAYQIFEPLFAEIFAHAPKGMRPTFHQQHKRWSFPNGAYVQAFGCEDRLKADHGRGPKARASFGDEMGFANEMAYAIESVISPQHLQTHGMICLASSPPLSPDHPFCKYEDAARARGSFWHLDIFTPGLDGIPDPHGFVEARARTLNTTVADFKKTDEYRRELLGQRVVSRDRAAFPEWQDVKEVCRTKFQVPEFPLNFESVDLGYLRHKTGYLLVSWDFLTRRVLVRDELLLSRATTSELISRIRAKRFEHLGADPKLYRSLMDDPSGRIIADVAEAHGMSFSVPEKKDWDAALALARTYLADGKVLVDPRCHHLLHQLDTGLLDASGQLRDNGQDGHLDLLACLVYAVRAIHAARNINPIPPARRMQDGDYWPEVETAKKRNQRGVAGALRRISRPRR